MTSFDESNYLNSHNLLHLNMTGGGVIPSGAIQGGVTSNGEKLYIGRVRHEGSFCIGKVSFCSVKVTLFNAAIYI
jgi:GTPase